MSAISVILRFTSTIFRPALAAATIATCCAESAERSAAVVAERDCAVVYLLCAFRHPKDNAVALLDVDIEQGIGMGIGEVLKNE
jgi:hypothetical protein